MTNSTIELTNELTTGQITTYEAASIIVEEYGTHTVLTLPEGTECIKSLRNNDTYYRLPEGQLFCHKPGYRDDDDHGYSVAHNTEHETHVYPDTLLPMTQNDLDMALCNHSIHQVIDKDPACANCAYCQRLAKNSEQELYEMMEDEYREASHNVSHPYTQTTERHITMAMNFDIPKNFNISGIPNDPRSLLEQEQELLDSGIDEDDLNSYYPNIMGNGHPDTCLCSVCAPGEYEDYDDYDIPEESIINHDDDDVEPKASSDRRCVGY